jgi:hypothetical protein
LFSFAFNGTGEVVLETWILTELFARLKLFYYSKPKKNLRWLLIIQQ